MYRSPKSAYSVICSLWFYFTAALEDRCRFCFIPHVSGIRRHLWGAWITVIMCHVLDVFTIRFGVSARQCQAPMRSSYIDTNPFPVVWRPKRESAGEMRGPRTNICPIPPKSRSRFPFIVEWRRTKEGRDERRKELRWFLRTTHVRNDVPL